jgi:DNA-binding Xre family transcriptional regulator
MKKSTGYLIDYQRDYFSQNCIIVMHIGEKIYQIVKEKGVKVNWLAEQVNTTRSNMQKIFKRDDISVLTLTKISKALNYNFLHDVESEASLLTNEPEMQYSKQNELLKEQLELSQKLLESKDKLLKEYKIISAKTDTR